MKLTKRHIDEVVVGYGSSRVEIQSKPACIESSYLGR